MKSATIPDRYKHSKTSPAVLSPKPNTLTMTPELQVGALDIVSQHHSSDKQH